MPSWQDAPEVETPKTPAYAAAPESAPAMSAGDVAKLALGQGATLGFGSEVGGVAKTLKNRTLQGKGTNPLGRQTPGPRELGRLYPGVPYPEAASRWFNENRPDLASAAEAEAARQDTRAAYLGERNAIRAQQDQAYAESPWLYRAAYGVGAIPGAVLTGGGPVTTQGAPLLVRAVQGAKAAAPVGALIGGLKSDDPTLRGTLADAAMGGVAAGTLGAALPAVGDVVKKGAQVAADKLGGVATEWGNKALRGWATINAKKPVSADAVEQAYATGVIRPWNTIRGIAAKLDKQGEEYGAAYAALLKDLEAKGFTGPDAQAMVARLIAKANAEAPGTFGPLPDAFRQNAAEVAGKVLPGKTDIGLTQGIDLTRSLQTAAKGEYAKIPTQVSELGDAKMALASEWRQALEDAVAAQAAKDPKAAAAFVPLKQRLANTLEARNVARVGEARAVARKPISLADMATAAAFTAHSGDPLTGLVAGTASHLIEPRLAAAGGYFSRALANAARGVAGAQPAASTATVPFLAPAKTELQLLAEAMRRAMGGPALVPAGADEGNAK